MSRPGVLVTGGSRGIGRAIVGELVAAGYPCVFTWVQDRAAAEATLAAVRERHPGATVESRQLDVRDPAAVDAVVDDATERLGTIGALVNNAAIVRNNAAVMMSNEEWDDVLRADLFGPFYVARALLMHFLSRRDGRIVNISSVAAGGCSGGVNYAAAKAGLEGMTRTLAREYGGRGVRCNAVSVGYVPTDLTAASLSARLESYWTEYCPLRRVATGEEVARVVRFLISDDSSFVNGEVLSVAGGLTYSP